MEDEYEPAFYFKSSNLRGDEAIAYCIGIDWIFDENYSISDYLDEEIEDAEEAIAKAKRDDASKDVLEGLRQKLTKKILVGEAAQHYLDAMKHELVKIRQGKESLLVVAKNSEVFSFIEFTKHSVHEWKKYFDINNTKQGVSMENNDGNTDATHANLETINIYLVIYLLYAAISKTRSNFRSKNNFRRSAVYTALIKEVRVGEGFPSEATLKNSFSAAEKVYRAELTSISNLESLAKKGQLRVIHFLVLGLRHFLPADENTPLDTPKQIAEFLLANANDDDAVALNKATLVNMLTLAKKEYNNI